MSFRECEHCGSPDKDNIHECKWLENRVREMHLNGVPKREIDAFVRSGFDPPCLIDEWQEDMQKRDRIFGFWFLFFSFAPVIVAFALFLLFG